MTKVKNAVILAAGYSSRFVPLCFDIPKGLLIVKGETLIERQIQQLKELDINDICIVTGAYAEQFAFLEKKHHVRLIFNSDYKTKNNFASLYVAKECGEIKLPPYQRYFVWSPEKVLRLIENINNDLFIPPVILS